MRLRARSKSAQTLLLVVCLLPLQHSEARTAQGAQSRVYGIAIFEVCLDGPLAGEVVRPDGFGAHRSGRRNAFEDEAAA
uniref:Uncharacterized protein n=1 Tax=Mycena chlorophos TaxID=658473 RepID=A0ABQ0M846_MYCCL|nr:predicted protein [Mycena chlorophos]